MARFLLIHGAAHGAWCFERLIPELEALGHTARAIDLPGHGDDRTPISGISLEAYTSAVEAALEPHTILLGHSMGGYPITEAARRAPDMVDRLIYLCAYVPIPGVSLTKMRRMAQRQPLVEVIELAEDRETWTVAPEAAIRVFYHDVPEDIARAATARLRPQPTRPQADPPGPLPACPRSYILCAEDRTIPPEFQRHMVLGWPEKDVHEMQTSHSPFLSDPAGLARLLDRIAKG